jgi:hypothetical protein
MTLSAGENVDTPLGAKKVTYMNVPIVFTGLSSQDFINSS